MKEPKGGAGRKKSKEPPKAVARKPEVTKGFALLHEMDENAILENALDSLRMAVVHYNAKDHNWAIMASFHCIELLLKERLLRTHPLLIFRDIEEPVQGDSHTVGLKDTIKRFRNIGVQLDEGDVATLTSLQAERNRIEHHRFEPSKEHEAVLGKALRFIHRFMRDDLDESLEENVSAKDFAAIKQLILDYEEIVKRERRKIESKLESLHPKDRELSRSALARIAAKRPSREMVTAFPTAACAMPSSRRAIASDAATLSG